MGSDKHSDKQRDWLGALPGVPQPMLFDEVIRHVTIMLSAQHGVSTTQGDAQRPDSC